MQQIFGFPVYITSIDKNLYDKEEIIKDIEYNYNKDKKRNAWDSGDLHHSYNDGGNENFKKINYNKLMPVYKNVFNEFFKNLKLKTREYQYNFQIVNYTCLTTSQSMKSHIHEDCDFTAVHFIQFDETVHTSTLFENNNNYFDMRPNLKNFLDDGCLLNSWYFNNIKFNIKEDDICITPSFLPHSVSGQLKTDKKRITIVCNIYIK
jgi:hypothetical protein